MPIGPDDIDALRTLEESLWRAETRFDRAHMERVLAPDFFEFGRSGRTYDRTATLALDGDSIRATLPLARFAVHPIGRDAALVTYVSEVVHDTVQRANRSSLWLRTEEGWRLKFHQGTPVQ